ncbi:MAG: hypothetical protein HRT66_12180 [Flavobacteriaceae bacterium]|nr:hypothetical protein [Flavobacteriaceae bacterium]
MRKIITSLILIVIIASCSKNESVDIPKPVEPELVGEWKLTEILADAGDGNGVFQPTESNKTIRFKADGTIVSDISLCNPYSEEIIYHATYDLSTNSITTGCENTNISSIWFEISGENLILNFLSIEGYSQKFEKIE